MTSHPPIELKAEVIVVSVVSATSLSHHSCKVVLSMFGVEMSFAHAVSVSDKESYRFVFLCEFFWLVTNNAPKTDRMRVRV